MNCVYRNPARKRGAARRLCGTGGASAIEYGIILPVFLAFLLGIMDTGRLLWTYNTLHRATDAAARCAAVNTTTCGTTAQIKNEAVKAAWGLTIGSSAFTVATIACGAQVSASYEFKFVTPGLTTLALKASSCYPV
jgi:Flp pilus assembly protein TadG